MLKQMAAIIGRRRMKQTFILFLVMFFGSLLEMLGISLIVSVCSLMLDESLLMENAAVVWFCRWTGLTTARQVMMALIVVLMGLYLFKVLYLLLEQYILSRFSRGCQHELAVRLYTGVLALPYERFIASSSAELVNLLNSDVGRFAQFLNSCLQISVEGLVALSVGAFLVVIDPVMTAFAAVGIGVLLVLTRVVLKKRTYQSGVYRQQANRERLKWIHQAVHGVKDIKTSQREAFFCEQYREADQEFARAEELVSIWKKAPSVCIEAVMVICILLYILLLILSGRQMSDFYSSLSALVLVTVRLLPACSRISSNMTTLGYAKTSLESITKALEEMQAQTGAGSGQEQPVDLTEGIRLDKVSYGYEGRPEPVLSQVSMEIPVGSFVGIVGPSGAGKTTLMDVLLGLLEPRSGKVLVDGVDLRECRRSYQQKVAYIPQNVFLMDDSVRNNVTLGASREQVRDEEIWQALEKAALADMVRGLPDGLDTQVGEGGIRLSGGERQRLGIARALYRGGSLVVLDEATSALDPKTEASIIRSVQRLRSEKTVVIVSHRASAVAGCDRIYAVEDGTVRAVPPEERA